MVGCMDFSGVSFESLCETPPDERLPWIDRSDIDLSAMNSLQRVWRDRGFVILRSLIPSKIIDPYCEVWKKTQLELGLDRRAWGIGTPYMTVPELRDICLFPPLTAALNEILGTPMGLHLNLTDWKSTQRDWHQDDYLNPGFVNGHYAAVWIALGHIHPDSGPFEYVAGSHKWPLVRQAKVLETMGEDGSDPDWPWRSEELLTPLFTAQVQNSDLETRKFIPNKGDVLIWHSRLMHRGSVPINPSLERRALIAHYSSLDVRQDMPHRLQHSEHPLSWYFAL